MMHPGRLIIITCTALCLFGGYVFAAPELEKLLPRRLSGSEWQLQEEPYSYSPDNLYNYIDGAAELFIAFGFVRLAGGTYHGGPDRQAQVTVDIYDMGNTLNAYGVFQTKRDPEATALNIGAGAFGGKQYVFFYKGNYYVEIQAYVPNAQDSDAPLLMAREVDRRIPGDTAPPAELAYLPEDNRVPGSERYVTGGILGHGFLDRGLLCEYKSDGEIVKVFVAFFPSDEQAMNALDLYKKYLERIGERWEARSVAGNGGFVAQEPYQKNVLVVQQGCFVAGVAYLSHVERGEALLKGILKKVQKP